MLCPRVPLGGLVGRHEHGRQQDAVEVKLDCRRSREGEVSEVGRVEHAPKDPDAPHGRDRRFHT